MSLEICVSYSKNNNNNNNNKNKKINNKHPCLYGTPAKNYSKTISDKNLFSRFQI